MNLKYEGKSIHYFLCTRKNQIKKLLIQSPQGRQTRSSKKVMFKLRKPNTEKYKNSLSYSGFKLWNQLPEGVQRLDDLSAFKYRIKALIPGNRPLVKEEEPTP